MYTDFYNLKALPFQLTPDHRFFFDSSVHSRAMAHLTYGLSQGEGFIIITGDVGAGKTTLVGHLFATLDKARYTAAKIVNTQLGADDMLRMVASAFGIDQEGLDKATLLNRLEAFLTEHHRQGKRCLLIVDEAQNLSVQALEELRMLSNFQIDGSTPLQSFLLGQPQFRTTLASPELDQLRQRVIASYHLKPLEQGEIKAYIEHRLSTVGWQNDPEFTANAYRAIYKHTDGVPRRINTLVSRLLLYGCLEELHRLDAAEVEQVAEDLRAETEQVLDAVPATSKGNGHLPAPAERPSGDDGLADIAQRLDILEEYVRRHDRTIRRALQIAARYLEQQKP